VSELFKRILVAIIGIPLTVFLIYIGGIAFSVAVAVISSLAIIELFNFFKKKGVRPFTKTAILANIILITVTYLYIHNSLKQESNELLLFSLLIIIILIFLLKGLWSKKQGAMLNIITSLGGFFYISLTFIFLVLLREFGNLYFIVNRGISLDSNIIAGREPEFLLSLLIAIWLCDTMAYFVGKSIGKHKLFPSVSPKKTWEGAIGGFFGAVAGFVLCTQIPGLLKDFPLSQAIIIGIIIGTVGQIGDLAESKLKRDAGVKDSSSILPGHGGILDRFDSIMFVIPVIFIYLFFINY
jgi:phosphatidate cytidylyltransferase